jgi:hypothetical protein
VAWDLDLAQTSFKNGQRAPRNILDSHGLTCFGPSANSRRSSNGRPATLPTTTTRTSALSRQVVRPRPKLWGGAWRGHPFLQSQAGALQENWPATVYLNISRTPCPTIIETSARPWTPRSSELSSPLPRQAPSSQSDGRIPSHFLPFRPPRITRDGPSLWSVASKPNQGTAARERTQPGASTAPDRLRRMAPNVSWVAELFGWRCSCLARDVTAGKLARRPRSGRRRQPGSYPLQQDRPAPSAPRPRVVVFRRSLT